VTLSSAFRAYTATLTIEEKKIKKKKPLTSRLLLWRPVQEGVFFRALRAARAESLLRSSKAAREDSPKLPARLQSTKEQYFSHTQLSPLLASDSGRRVLSSAAGGAS
jgi:hypothetical protein